jgi:hypothetical protein
MTATTFEGPADYFGGDHGAGWAPSRPLVRDCVLAGRVLPVRKTTRAGLKDPPYGCSPYGCSPPIRGWSKRQNPPCIPNSLASTAAG